MDWNGMYREGRFPWDLGGPAPVVQALAGEVLSPGARVFVPGCGLAWDVEALAAQGHHVVGLDIAPAALASARARIAARPLAGSAELLIGDLLVRPGADPDGGEGFDAWAEHTCFCALDPALWPAYVEAAWRRLRPGGVLFGAFLHFEGGGPPFGTDPAEVRRLFAPRFEIERLEPWGVFANARLPQLGAVFRRRG